MRISVGVQMYAEAAASYVTSCTHVELRAPGTKRKTNHKYDGNITSYTQTH